MKYCQERCIYIDYYWAIRCWYIDYILSRTVLIYWLKIFRDSADILTILYTFNISSDILTIYCQGQQIYWLYTLKDILLIYWLYAVKDCSDILTIYCQGQFWYIDYILLGTVLIYWLYTVRDSSDILTIQGARGIDTQIDANFLI